MRKSVPLVGERAIREATVIRQWTDLALDLSDPDSLLMTAAAEVRRRMKLTDANIQLDLSNHHAIEASACYQKGAAAVISVAIETLQDPLRTVTSLAHEFGHHILLSDPVVKPASYDERLTELLPVCYGFGVLQSDASLYFNSWSMGEISGWQVSKSGYLNAQEIGYALALFARVRGEANPAWKRWLRADSRVTLQQALRYFQHRQKTGSPILFDADRIPDTNSTSRELAAWLLGDDPTFALAAAWRLCAMDTFDEPTIAALRSAAHSKDPDLVPLAISLLAGADDRDQATVELIKSLLRDRRPQVALAAARAAFGLGIDMSEHLGMLAWLLDKVEGDRQEVLQMMSAQGSAAAGSDGEIGSMPSATSGDPR